MFSKLRNPERFFTSFLARQSSPTHADGHDARAHKSVAGGDIRRHNIDAKTLRGNADPPTDNENPDISGRSNCPVVAVRGCARL